MCARLVAAVAARAASDITAAKVAAAVVFLLLDRLQFPIPTRLLLALAVLVALLVAAQVIAAAQPPFLMQQPTAVALEGLALRLVRRQAVREVMLLRLRVILLLGQGRLRAYHSL